MSQINQNYNNQLSTNKKQIIQKHKITVNKQIKKTQ